MRFYCDYELYHSADAPSDPSDPPDVVAISSFPTHQISGYAASFTSIQYDYATNHLDSLTEAAKSYGSFGSNFDDFNQSEKEEKICEGIVETEQVKSFWSLYNEYPAYLKKVKRRNRNRRRNKKPQ